MRRVKPAPLFKILPAGTMFALVWTGGMVAAAEPVDFNRDVAPVLSKNCFACHGPDDETREAGLRLDVRDVAIAKLDSGETAIVPGDVKASALVARITESDDSLRMPPRGAGHDLTPKQIDLLTRWVAEGAKYAAHWSFVPPSRPVLPAVKDRAWPKNGIDWFILAKLEAAGLRPNPPADRYTLARRASLDLRGLPPTPAEVDAFVNDTRPDAWERFVDGLLADAAYGERWARMWLDLARYADSAGYGSDPLRPNMWRYRDWVIDAFNRNLPYDRFTIEQLAGDLLSEPTLDQKIATAFHRNTMTNTEGGTDDEEFRVAAVKDRIDTTMQVWMGLTFGCAKCHNHKYEPITQKEYYQLFAAFNQTADADRGDESPLLQAPAPDVTAQIARIDEQIAALRKRLDAPTPELAAAQADWERGLALASEWTVLSPLEATAESGATLAPQPDGSILVSGPLADNDVYTVAARAPAGTITAIRLEAIPDPSLPARGSGRAPDGNFVLSKLSATAERDGQRGKPPAGRFVRIELPGENRMLHLAEVQVVSGGQNVATKGKAAQSSTDYDGPPHLAIDGNTDGRYFVSKSVTHTKAEKDPWWEVDLGEAQPIERVVVWNRTDSGTESRTTGFRVLVLDADRRPLWQQDQAEPPMPSAEFSPSGLRAIPLTQALADFSQEAFPVANALSQKDAKQSGWAVGPKMTEPHAAYFLAASGAKGAEPASATLLTFRLEHAFRMPKYTLGRFRLSVTTDPNVTKRLSVPADVLALVDTPAEKRSVEQAAKLAAYYRSIAPALAPLRDEVAKLEKSKPAIPTVPVMQELPEGQRRETFVMIKGNFLDKGAKVAAALPGRFAPGASSGPIDRMAVARWLVAAENPLTARVAVNRFWGQLFGVGLVETEEDFGSQGELPSHPKLLDWLAVEFSGEEPGASSQQSEERTEGAEAREGEGTKSSSSHSTFNLRPSTSAWDVKRLLKLIVTSATYQQSSHVTAEKLAADPRGRLLSRSPRFRLEAEMIRDQALALGGLLSRRTHGPSVYPYQPPGLWQAAFNGQRTWATSEGEDRYRRGLYTFWRRTIPYPSMATFDAPSREICAIRRIRTNTPLQAFVTLNDPVYVEAAQALARRIAKEGGATTGDRLRFALRLCTSRPPTDDQVGELRALFESELAYYRGHPDEAKQLATDPLGPLPEGLAADELAAWTVIANVLLNLDAVLTRG